MFANSLNTYNAPQPQEPFYLTKHTGLSDFPLKDQWLCLAGQFNDFDQAVCAVSRDIAHNNGKNKWTGIWADEIETVFNMYRNLVQNDSTLYEYTAEPRDERERDAILELLKIIAERSGVNYNQVVEIMKTLYWGVKDGRVRSSDALYPREAKTNNTDRGVKGSGGATEQVSDLIKWGVPLVIIGGILYGITKVVTLATLVKSGVADSQEVEANNEGE